jgi:hypothetical protein
MKSLSSNFINFFKSKSIIDFVYLVIMILIVTWLKDMVVFMYHKIKNKQWSTNTFSKAKQSGEAGEAVKLMEGFTGAGVFPTTCDVIPALTATSFPSVCDKLKFLLCNDNFEKLRRLLGGITTQSTHEYQFTINTHGGEIVTSGGNIKTGSINGTATSTSGGTIYTDKGNIITRGGNINTIGGGIDTGTGTITSGGRINANGGINTGTGTITSGGLITAYGGGINTNTIRVTGNGGITVVTGGLTVQQGLITANGGINSTGNIYCLKLDCDNINIRSGLLNVPNTADGSYLYGNLKRAERPLFKFSFHNTIRMIFGYNSSSDVEKQIQIVDVSKDNDFGYFKKADTETDW